MFKKALVIGLIQFATLWGGDVFAARPPRVIPPAGSTPVTNPPVTISGDLAGVCRSSSASAC